MTAFETFANVPKTENTWLHISVSFVSALPVLLLFTFSALPFSSLCVLCVTGFTIRHQQSDHRYRLVALIIAVAAIAVATIDASVCVVFVVVLLFGRVSRSRRRLTVRLGARAFSSLCLLFLALVAFFRAIFLSSLRWLKIFYTIFHLTWYFWFWLCSGDLFVGSLCQLLRISPRFSCLDNILPRVWEEPLIRFPQTRRTLIFF